MTALVAVVLNCTRPICNRRYAAISPTLDDSQVDTCAQCLDRSVAPGLTGRLQRCIIHQAGLMMLVSFQKIDYLFHSAVHRVIIIMCCEGYPLIIRFVPFHFHLFARRGISSTVRRCIDKETGKEYAAKIIDLGAAETGDSNHMLEATRQEIQILRQVMGHKFISKYTWPS